MDAPGEVVLDIFLFLSRFHAEKCRHMCRKWSHVVGNNEDLWDYKVTFASVTDRPLPKRSELMRDPVYPVFDEPVKHGGRHWQYEASQVIRLITNGEGRRQNSSKVAWLCVKDSEYLEFCSDDCDFHGSRSRSKEDVSLDYCRVTLERHVSSADLLDFVRQQGTPLIYYFGYLTHVGFARQFLVDTACLNAEQVTISFVDYVIDFGVMDKAIIDYCFSPDSSKRQLDILGYLPSAKLLPTIVEKFFHADSTESFPSGVWISTIGMELEELRPNPPPCLPLRFTDADHRYVGYAYVVPNPHT